MIHESVVAEEVGGRLGEREVLQRALPPQQGSRRGALGEGRWL